MLLLHLSDLHFGNKNRFAGLSAPSLGRAFARSLNAARLTAGLPDDLTIQLVIVTGDLAESGLPSEFAYARDFILSLGTELGLSPDRFAILPGNHDISWPACRKVRAACSGEEFPVSELEQRLFEEKFGPYRELLSSIYGGAAKDGSLTTLPNIFHLPKGGWLRDFPGLRMSVGLLNTSERENDEIKGGFLSAEQAQALMDLWLQPARNGYLKIVALHHNPIASTLANRKWTIEWLREQEKKMAASLPMSAEAFAHYISDLAGLDGAEHLTAMVRDAHVHLILHGHHHDQGIPTSWHWDKDGSAPVMSVGSFGLSERYLPGDAPLSCQFIHFLTAGDRAPRLQAIPLVFDGRFRLTGQTLVGAFRPQIPSDAAYDQPLPLPSGWSATSDTIPATAISTGDKIPRPPMFYAEPPYIGSHQFVGRQQQLETLNEWASPAETHAVLLFEAIGGTGKSMLTWEWTTKHSAGVRTDWTGRMWYSFYDKGATMLDFCRRALVYMSGASSSSLRDKNVAELSRILLRNLQAKPWLIVLDGIERVLVAYHRFDAAQIPDESAGDGDAIAHRNPCSAINPEDDDLLHALAGANPSKILITSRLVPRVLLNQSNQAITGVVRERLPGLRPTDAEALIRSCGVIGTSTEIQSFLKSHCDCHPLVIGVLAGLINDYLPDRGNFDAWAGDPNAGGHLNIAKLDLAQKRNHILSSATRALSESSRQLIATMALLSEAIDYKVLVALNPHVTPPPEEVLTPDDPSKDGLWIYYDHKTKKKKLEDYSEAMARLRNYQTLLERRQHELADGETKLSETVKDLERRGLLQYDSATKRYDLHPVVRGFAAGGLRQEEKERYGQLVVDNFSQQASNPYEDATSLDDFLNARRIVRALFLMGRLEAARDFILDNHSFLQCLGTHFEAHNEILAILRPFFAQGWKTISPCIAALGTRTFTKRATVALRRIGALSDAFAVSEAELVFSISKKRPLSAGQLLNLAITAGDNNWLALEDRLMGFVERLARLAASPTEVTSFRLARLRQLARLGKSKEAEALFHILKKDMLQPYGQAVLLHHYAVHRLFAGTLTEEDLTAAESAARSCRSALGERNMRGLRGYWHLGKQEWKPAKECLTDAVALANKVGKQDRRAEIRLAIARLKLGEGCSVENAERLSLTDEPECARPVGELWSAIGDPVRAMSYAWKAHQWACGDGEPYVRRYELKQTIELLRALGSDAPNTTPFDRTKGHHAWEADIAAAVLAQERLAGEAS